MHDAVTHQVITLLTGTIVLIVKLYWVVKRKLDVHFTIQLKGILDVMYCIFHYSLIVVFLDTNL